ncbi:MAG: hypothetical protein U9Q15_02990 [Patescibacteria group bacterium]|nr:hypothetical protein [Patescibacteria group bacterium]
MKYFQAIFALLAIVSLQSSVALAAYNSSVYIQGLSLSASGSALSGDLLSQKEVVSDLEYIIHEEDPVTQTGVIYDWSYCDGDGCNGGLGTEIEWKSTGFSGSVLPAGVLQPGEDVKLFLTPWYATGGGVFTGETISSQKYTMQSTTGFAWNEVIGYLSVDNTYYGSYIYNNKLEGYIWSENAGYVHLSGSGYGIQLVETSDDHVYMFSGSAWSEYVGYIHFEDWSQYDGIDATDFNNNKSFAYVDQNGNIQGYGYSDYIGYVSFDHNHISDLEYQATTTFRPNHPPTLAEGNIQVLSEGDDIESIGHVYYDSDISIEIIGLSQLDLDGDTVEYVYQWKTNNDITLAS